MAGIALKPSTRPSLFYLLGLEKRINNHFVDIRDYKKVERIVFKEKPEIIFHLAAQPLVRDSYDEPLYTLDTNIMGTANLLEAARKFGKVRSVVIITTDKVYEDIGKPRRFKETDELGGYDPYSSSKVGVEIITKSYIKSFFNPEYSIRTLIASARSGNVIAGGDWQKDRILPDIIRAVFEKKEKLVMRNPGSIRPFQYVLEPLYGYLLLAKKLYEGKKEFSGAWNFGPEEKKYLAVEEMSKKIFKMLKKGSYVVKRDKKKHEADFLKLDIGKAKNILGWKPRLNISRSLKLTLDWYQDFYDKKDVIEITDKQIKTFFEKI